jgi:hypothetical protein
MVYSHRTIQKWWIFHISSLNVLNMSWITIGLGAAGPLQSSTRGAKPLDGMGYPIFKPKYIIIIYIYAHLYSHTNVHMIIYIHIYNHIYPKMYIHIYIHSLSKYVTQLYYDIITSIYIYDQMWLPLIAFMYCDIYCITSHGHIHAYIHIYIHMFYCVCMYIYICIIVYTCWCICIIMCYLHFY